MEAPGRPDNQNNQDSFRRFGNDAKSRSQAKNPVLAPISTPADTPREDSLGQTLDKLSGDKERSGRMCVSKPPGPSPGSSRRGPRPGPMRATRPITPKVNSLQSTLELLASDKERSDQLLDLERSRLQTLADVDASASGVGGPRLEGSSLKQAAAEARNALFQGAADGALERVLGALRAAPQKQVTNDPCLRKMPDNPWAALYCQFSSCKPTSQKQVTNDSCLRLQGSSLKQAAAEARNALFQGAADGGLERVLGALRAASQKQVTNDPCLRKMPDNPWAALYSQFPSCKVQSRQPTKLVDPCLRKSAEDPWTKLYQQFPDARQRA